MKKGTCNRCGDLTPTWDFETERTFVGFLKVATLIQRKRTINNTFNYVLGHGKNTTVRTGEDDYTLCENCWSDFVGYFMQNRTIPLRKKA